MKKNLITFSLLLTSTLLLTSCNFVRTESFTFIPNETNSTIYDGYYKPNSLRYTYQDINKSVGWTTSNTIGVQKLLIVPVSLQDGPSWDNLMLKRIENAFFGESIYPYYSVKEYFEISSYSKLTIEGDVYEPLTLNMTINELASYGDSASEIVAAAFNESFNISDLSYDQDNDGYIDNTIFIYSNGFDPDSSYWAWCTYTNSYNSNNVLNVNSYMWASYEFLNTAYDDFYHSEYYEFDRENYAETHTLIHETGHLLGLDDYYDYDSIWDCSTGYDMQAYNIGDHNIFSKMSLGWVKPYVVTDSCEITLHTSSLYPECVLIKNDFNGSAFDEYLLIEYYTPQGLNELDSIHSYGANNALDYSGLRVYHVDARMIAFESLGFNQVLFGGYTDTINSNVVIGASNTPSRSYLSSHEDDYKLLHLIDNHQKNTLSNKPSPLSPTYCLIQEKQTIDKEYLKPYLANKDSFNDGEKINFSFTASNFTDQSCTLTIEIE